jgi:hypothetical protein
VFAFAALFAASFIIFNTFSIITAQRTRSCAVRAIGDAAAGNQLRAR